MVLYFCLKTSLDTVHDHDIVLLIACIFLGRIFDRLSNRLLSWLYNRWPRLGGRSYRHILSLRLCERELWRRIELLRSFRFRRRKLRRRWSRQGWLFRTLWSRDGLETKVGRRFWCRFLFRRLAGNEPPRRRGLSSHQHCLSN